MNVRLIACIAALVLLAGCAETALVCGPGRVRDDNGMCVDDPVDGGQSDAGHDATVPPDAGPCDPACTGGEVCVEIDEEVFECVQCGSDTDCGDGFCVANTCVDCRDHGDCTSPEAAQCMDGSCVPCSDSAHCEGTGGTICDTSGAVPACVECNLTNSSACSVGATCDLLAGSCVDIAPASQTTCAPCTNDLQCAPDHRCIRMEFMGTLRDTGHCLRREAASCANPYRVIITSESVSGAASDRYCGIDQDRATCEAVLALIGDASCTGDGMCVIDGTEVPVAGAICERVAGTDDKCTYACEGLASHCPGSLGCGATSMYCGGP